VARLVTTRRAIAATLTAVVLLVAAAPVAAAPVPAPSAPTTPNGLTTSSTSATDPKGTDVIGQLFGRERFAGHLGSFPLSAYQLDWNVDTDVDLGPVPVAPKPKGAVADVAEAFANILWTIALLIAKIIGGLFAWAFSVDFLTGPHGILRPIAGGARVMYRDLFGREILYAAIVVAGGYAIATWRSGERGRSTSWLVAAVAYAVVAAGVANNMTAVAAPVFRATQEVSSSVLAMRATGTISPSAAEREANQHIRNTFIDGPFQILEFGGLAHCVGGKVRNGFPTPVLADDPGPKTCRVHAPYARKLLAEPPGSDARKRIVTDLASGRGDFDKIDAPAADMMLEGNAYLRLVIALGVLVGMLFVGAFILLAGLLIALASLAFAIGLAFAPVMAPAAFIPVYGEATVRFWASALAGCLVVKVAYSLALGVLLIANQAVTAAAGLALPAGYAYLVNAAMFAGALYFRKSIRTGISGMTARVDRSASGGARRFVTQAVVHPVRTAMFRNTMAATAGAAAGAAAVEAVEHGRDDDRRGGDAPAWTEPPHDHEPRGGAAPPRPRTSDGGQEAAADVDAGRVAR
jgi:hypothetical protein